MVQQDPRLSLPVSIAAPVGLADDKAIPEEPQAFVMDWHIPDSALSPHEAPPCLFVCPYNQSSQLEAASSLLANQLLALGSAELDLRLGQLEHDDMAFHCVVIARSAWQRGVDEAGYVAFMQLLQRLAKSPCRLLRVLTHAAVRCEPAYPRVRHPLDAVYLGMAQAFGKEVTRLEVQAWSLAHLDNDHVGVALRSNPDNPNGGPICIGNGSIWCSTMVRGKLDAAAASSYRRGGTYLIIGGRGGIGAALARHLAQQHHASIVLVGRGAADDGLMRELKALGGKPSYERLDIAEDQALARAMSKYRTVDGIFHSALHLADATFAQMTQEQLLQALRPKVHGSFQLLNALRRREQHPDFIVFFSSVQSYIAYPGQANYTAASQCKDAMADLFEATLSTTVKTINWGYWGSVGVVSDTLHRERMQRFQIGSIEAGHAMPFIEQLLASPWKQLTYLRQSERSLRLRHIDPHRHGDLPARLAANPRGKTRNLLEREKMDSPVTAITAITALLASRPMPQGKIEQEAEALDRYARSRWHQVRRAHSWSVAVKHARQWRALSPIPDSESPGQEEFLRLYPRLRSHVALLEQCLTHYPAVIAGKKSALEVLFPHGDASLLRNWYAETPGSRAMNARLGDVILAHSTATGNDRLRILEIGAGTGATPRIILPMIAECVAEYCFTDTSDAFLKSAGDEFAAYPFMRYQKLDATRIPESLHGYDVIVATNVLHAVSPLGNVLRGIARALSGSGVLLLNETVHRHDVLTIAFGIIDGWWHPDDTTVQRIADSPLLDTQSWRQALLTNGFGEIATYGNNSVQLIAAAPERIVSAVEPKASMPDSRLDRGSCTRIEDRLRRIVGDVILLAPEDLDLHAPLADYGVDSILALKIIEQISAEFGEQSSDLLERWPTLRALAEHLAGSRPGSEIAALVSETLSKDTRNTGTTVSPQHVQRLARIVGTVILLDPDDLDLHTPLIDYGVDSILALKIIEQISAEFGEQSADLLERWPTIHALAQHLEGALPDGEATVPAAEAMPGATKTLTAPPRMRRLAEIVGAVILLDPGDLDPLAPLSDYGVDSILALKIIEQISSEFGEQPADLLEQHTSLHALAQHLAPPATQAVPQPTPAVIEHLQRRNPEAVLVATIDEGETSDLIAHHVVAGRSIAPGAYALSWMTEASGSRKLKNVRWHMPMVRLKDAALEYRDGRFKVMDRRGGYVLCSGEYDLAPDAPPAPLAARLTNAEVFDPRRIYRRFGELGYDYGPLYQGIMLACSGEDRCISVLACPRECEKVFPPALIDAGLQTSILLSDNGQGGAAALMLPTHLGCLNLYGLPEPGETILCEARLVARHASGARFDFQYARLAGDVLCTLSGMLAVTVPAQDLVRSAREVTV